MSKRSIVFFALLSFSLVGQTGFLQAIFRGFAALIFGKRASLGPLAERRTFVHLMSVRHEWRHHQIPAHERERGGMAEFHSLTYPCAVPGDLTMHDGF